MKRLPGVPSDSYAGPIPEIGDWRADPKDYSDSQLAYAAHIACVCADNTYLVFCALDTWVELRRAACDMTVDYDYLDKQIERASEAYLHLERDYVALLAEVERRRANS